MCKFGCLSEEDNSSSNYLASLVDTVAMLPLKVDLLRHLLPRRRVFHPDPTKGGGRSRHPFGIPKRGAFGGGRSFPDARGMMSAVQSLCALSRRGDECGVGFDGTLCLCTDIEFVQARLFVRGRYCLVTISPSDTSHKDAGALPPSPPKGAVTAAIPLESLDAGRSSWTHVPRRAGGC